MLSDENKLQINKNKALTYGGMIPKEQPLFKIRLDMTKEFTKLYFKNGNYIYKEDLNLKNLESFII